MYLHSVFYNRFAYVDFATPDAKTVAITLSENHLDGRRLLIKDGSCSRQFCNWFCSLYISHTGDDYSGRPSTSTHDDETGNAKTDKLTGHSKTAQKILASQKQPAGPTLFLGNLGFETTEQSIRGMLESHRVKLPATEDQNDGSTEHAGETQTKQGWIRKIRMGTFEDSGKCKGYESL